MDENIKKQKILKEIKCIFLTFIAAILSATGLHVFVYPANFAPSGIDGIATMLMQITGISAGYYTLIFNLPLLMIAYFILKKRYVIYTIVFTILSSSLLVLLDTVDFYSFVSEGERLVPALFSGAILGVRTGIMLKFGASTGGIDIVASMIQKKKPHLNIERIIAIICYGIAICSYFVYGDVMSILLSILQMFVFDRFAAYLLRDNRNAIEFKIITKNPQAIKDDIIYKLKHGATIVEGRGMYTDESSSVIISVINVRQIPEFLEIIKEHPDSFAYYGELLGVSGNFRWNKDDVAK